MSVRYSPHPIGQYKIPGMERTDIDVIAGHPQGAAIWNLFWMSNPSLDGLIGADRLNWHKRYTQVSGLSSSVIADVSADAVLANKLYEHPNVFRLWWSKEDHQSYEAYYRVPGWASIVSRQAEKASVMIYRRELDIQRSSKQRFSMDFMKGGPGGKEKP